MAWMEPMIPGSTPSTPASAQLGASSAGGGSGTMSRYVGPWSGSKTVTMPSKRKMEPCTTGMPSFTDASFTRKRVGKLSVPSTMTSQPGRMSMTLSAPRRTS